MRTVDDYAKYRTAHRDGKTIRQEEPQSALIGSVLGCLT